MTLLGRSPILVGSIAVAIIVIGLLLAGGVQGNGAPVSPTVRTSAGAGVQDGRSGQFALRDYEELSGGPDPDLPSSDWVGLLGGMGTRLLFVLALIYIAIRALRRYVYRSPGAGPGKRKPILLLGSLNLSQNRTVYVLEVARKVLVVGGTPGQLSLLAEVTDAEAIDEMRPSSSGGPPLEEFSSLLNLFRGRLGESAATALGPVQRSLQAKPRTDRDVTKGELPDVRRSPERD